jgi:hypothetical protein
VSTIEGIPGFPPNLRVDMDRVTNEFLPLFLTYTTIRGELVEFDKYVLRDYQKDQSPPLPSQKLSIQHPLISSQTAEIVVPNLAPAPDEILEELEAVRRRIKEKQLRLQTESQAMTADSFAAEYQKLSEKNAALHARLDEEKAASEEEKKRLLLFVGGLSDDLLHICGTLARTPDYFDEPTFEEVSSGFLTPINEGVEFNPRVLKRVRRRLDQLFERHPPNG